MTNCSVCNGGNVAAGVCSECRKRLAEEFTAASKQYDEQFAAKAAKLAREYNLKFKD